MRIEATDQRREATCASGDGGSSATEDTTATTAPTASDVKRAARRRYQDGPALATAWRKHVTQNRTEFRRELREAARLLRDGTRADIAAFASRNAPARAAAALARRKHHASS
jgi:hypothetical protein